MTTKYTVQASLNKVIIDQTYGLELLQRGMTFSNNISTISLKLQVPWLVGRPYKWRIRIRFETFKCHNGVGRDLVLTINCSL